MENLFHIRAKREHPFWRCGVKFTRKGGEFAQDRFTEEEWTRLRSEKMLHIKKLSAGEVTPGQAEVDLEARIETAIRGLSAEEFGTSGVPGVGAIRAALPQDVKAITTALRDTIFERMSEAGFEAPEPSASDESDIDPDHAAG